jgi:hypothetical protein
VPWQSVKRGGEGDLKRHETFVGAYSGDGFLSGQLPEQTSGSRMLALIVNAKNSFRITRKTRFLKKAGFPDLSGKNVYHIQTLH